MTLCHSSRAKKGCPIVCLLLIFQSTLREGNEIREPILLSGKTKNWPTIKQMIDVLRILLVGFKIESGFHEGLQLDSC